MADCVAVIVVAPGFNNVTNPSLMETTVGSDALKLHIPSEVDVGGFKIKRDDADICAVTSGNAPTVGVGPWTVRVIDAVADP